MVFHRDGRAHRARLSLCIKRLQEAARADDGVNRSTPNGVCVGAAALVVVVTVSDARGRGLDAEDLEGKLGR